MGSVRTPTDPWRTPIYYAKTQTPPQLIFPNYQVVVMLWNCCCEQLGIRHNNIKHGPLFKFFFKSTMFCEWPCIVFNQFPPWQCVLTSGSHMSFSLLLKYLHENKIGNLRRQLQCEIFNSRQWWVKNVFLPQFTWSVLMLYT